MAVVGNAEVLVRPTFSGFQRSTRKAMQGLGPEGTLAGTTLGERVSSGFRKAAKVGMAAAGGVVIGGLGAALTKGLGRLTAIENAQAKMRGLGHDTATVDTIMKNALASVKGTSFGLGEAATIAAAAVAAGIKPGQELAGHLTRVSNNAAAAGISMEEMGSIFNKAATQANGVQNDVISQLADRGIPIYQALADQMGVTAGEVFKMASEGKVDFETFSAAAEAAAGTVAEEMGGTFTGSLANAWAALGRGGAALLSGVFDKFAPALQGMTGGLDRLEPVARRVGERLGEFVSGIVDGFVRLRDSALVQWLQDGLEGIVKVFTGGGTGQLAKWLGVEQNHAIIDFLQGVRDFVTVDIPAGFEFLRGVIEGVFNIFTQQGTGLLAKTLGVEQDHWVIGFFQDLRDHAVNLFTYVRDEAVPALADMWQWVMDNKAVVGAFVGTIVAVVGALKTFMFIKTATAAVKAFSAALVANPIGLVITAIAALVAALVWLYQNNEDARRIMNAAWDKIKTGISAVVTWVRDVAWPWMRDAFQWIGEKATTLWRDYISPAFQWIWDKVRTVAGWVKDTAWPWMRDAFANIGDRATRLKDGAVAAFDGIKSGISTAWDGAKRILDRFKEGLRQLRTAFGDARDGIRRVWSTIGAAIARPINTVIDSINTFLQRLQRNLNKIPGVDLGGTWGGIPHVPVPVGDTSSAGQNGWGSGSTGPVMLAGGSWVPGHSPHSRADNIPAMLTADEFVTRQKSARSMRRNFPGWLEHVNRHGRPPGYADGGRVGGTFGDALAGAGNFLWDLFKSPLNTVRGWFDQLLGGFGDSWVAQAAVGAIRNVAGDIADWVRENIFGGADPSGVPGPVGPAMGWQGIWGLVKSLFPDAILTSAVRQSTVAGYGGLSLHALGRAVDFAMSPARMVAATKFLSSIMRWTELIHTPAGMWQQNRGRNTADFLPITRANHRDHVHAAMNTGGWAKPLVADSGALLAPGLNVLDNRTGGPEPLVRADRELDLTDGTIGAFMDGLEKVLKENRGAFVQALVTAGRGA